MLRPECEELARKLLGVDNTFAYAAFEAEAKHWGAALQNVEDGMTQLDALVSHGAIDGRDIIPFEGPAAILFETIRDELIEEDPLALARELHEKAEELMVDKVVRCQCGEM